MTLDVLFPVMNIISPHKFSAHANVHELIAILSTEKKYTLRIKSFIMLDIPSGISSIYIFKNVSYLYRDKQYPEREKPAYGDQARPSGVRYSLF